MSESEEVIYRRPWNNQYETCDSCNYDRHMCGFCGERLDHDEYDRDGEHHTVAYCRPDLVEHEPGPLCTFPDDPESNKYREPWCYWDHENGGLRER